MVVSCGFSWSRALLNVVQAAAMISSTHMTI